MRQSSPDQPITLATLAALPPAERARRLAEDAGHTARWVYAAACQGVVEAQTALGQMLLDGRGTPADASAARRWFALAAQAGHAPAANMLGRCLERGWGGQTDLPAAAAWYWQAARASLDWGQYNLANMLLRGRGVARDVPQSLCWFLRAAHQGHAKSMNLVGRFLEEGWATPADPAAAAIWYRRAAAGGDFRAQYNLATLLAVSGRLTEALAWFRQAGKEGSQDFRRHAAEALLRRPEPALRRAGREIAARCCEGGEGADFHRYGTALAAEPEPQPKLARAWLQRALAAGVAEAAEGLARLDAVAAVSPWRWRRRH